ncbi:MAG: hypothetical protein FD174_1936 [Geobacteraceae bacterium]|nr:MAG: hypothetical protein FD174_1936 [Geobacteraceae bacterium]
MECLRCGTCCTAPDITAMGKPLGVRCAHLTDTMQCAIYDERPAVCRGYRPDEICLSIAAPTMGERVEKYLRLFDM